MPVYLKYGSVQGAVTNASFPGWIELESFSWGFSVAVSTAVGAAGNRLGAGKVTPSDVVISKMLDDSSIQMVKDSFEGKITPTVQLAVVQMAGDQLADKYVEYTLSKVIVSSHQISGSGGGADDRPHETFTLNFSQFQSSQEIRDANNQPRKLVAGYDFEAAKKM